VAGGIPGLFFGGIFLQDRLVLGTAQLGMVYGVAGGEVPSYERASCLLKSAWEAGVRILDTARLYGESEDFIGRFMSDTSFFFNVITKISGSRDDMQKQFQVSLSRLNLDSVYGLMLHHGKLLSGPHARSIVSFMLDQRDSGRARKVGFSCYDPDEALAAIDEFKPDVVQIPLNLMDRRFIASGVLQRLKDMGAEVHVRSCFLQGLMLMEPQLSSEKVKGVAPYVESVWRRAKDLGVSPMSLALSFCLSQPQVDLVVVGVDSPSQLMEILRTPIISAGQEIYRGLECDDLSIIDPRSWSR